MAAIKLTGRKGVLNCRCNGLIRTYHNNNGTQRNRSSSLKGERWRRCICICSEQWKCDSDSKVEVTRRRRMEGGGIKRRNMMEAVVVIMWRSGTGLPCRAEEILSEDVVDMVMESPSEGEDVVGRDKSEIEETSPSPPPAATVSSLATFDTLHDKVLAYTILYPTNAADGKAIRWFTTRKPEKYSSAPPLTTDARQRVVYEAINFSDSLTATVSVGPPSPESPLQAYVTDENNKRVEVRPQDVKVKDFVLAVLLDRVASPRRPDGTRSTVARLEESERVKNGGDDETNFYFRYIYTVDGPSSVADGPGAKPRSRRTVASTALRDGYLYTYSLSCPQSKWDTFGEAMIDAVNEFAIESSREARQSEEYVSPESAPWNIF